jgi:hypothetical protein
MSFLNRKSQFWVVCPRFFMTSMIVFFGLSGLASISAAQLSPIWLRPGQCVMISSQQICAENPGQTQQGSTTTTTVDPAKMVDQRLFVCKWGAEDSSEPGIKGWGLYQVKIMGDSSKQEVLVKNYGAAGQKECEASAKAQKVQ